MQIPRPRRRATSPLLGTLSTCGRMATAGSTPQRGGVLYCLLALLSLLFLASGEVIFEERFDDVSCRRSRGRTRGRSSRNCSRSKKTLKRKNQKPLFEELLKVKEGASISQSLYFRFKIKLMLLRFIFLQLMVFKGMTQRTCILEGWTFSMLPCKTPDDEATTKESFVAIGTTHTKVIRLWN
ncbi:hypothetical protein ZEAMMB73_Zm00001d048517 [Zea mays]|uniref:Uncharacterized protein n=1 Tax=Zea mays TaxID=4577 RepID=A0A1D6PLI6_MAIZE|nr:hypothetical protein ZEAMMB73_Zm00001d048517 [Zea mays]